MAQAGVSANRLELLQIADAVAREKAIDRQVVIMAMEDAIQKAAKSRYGSENEIKAEVDPKTGEIRLARLLEVVEQVTMEATQISLEEARRRNPAAQVGDFIAEPLPPLDFGRVAAQNAKQVIVQKVREAERERQFDEYKDRVGEIVNGIVKRVEYGNVIVDLGRAEAIVRRDETLPRENFRYGDRIRAYVYDVRREQRGPQIFLSRTHPEFMAKLFAQEVPEVYDGIVTIKSVARDPGSRAKIAVVSRDASIDPVGACVGMRGSRVQAVVNELQGEKIDIIQWSPDAATFIVNALAPAEVVKVVLDEDAERIEVVVPDAQLSLAIGRKGQNVRLASQLTGWDIDIMTEASESERRQAEFAERSSTFMEALDVDEVIAQLLASEGFSSVEEVAFVEPSEIASIEGFDENTAAEIQTRAREHLEKIEAEQDAKRKALGVSDDVAAIPGLTTAMLVALGEKNVKTVEDLADCATDDLLGWNERKDKETIHHEGILDNFTLGKPEIEDLILAARVKAGWISEADLAPPPEAEADAEAKAKATSRTRPRTAAPRHERRPLPGAFEEHMPLRQDVAEHEHESETDDTVRRCALTRMRLPKEDLIRFVLAPSGEIVPDLKERLPGRGVWVTADRAIVAEAAKRNVFARALKAQAKVPAGLADQVDRLLADAALGALALANKAGEVVFGTAKVEEAIAKGKVAALIHASDAAEDGCRKLDGKFRAGARDGNPAPIRVFSADELGLASGKTNVIHAALIQGGAAAKFLASASRAERYRKGTAAFAQPIGSDTDKE